MKDAGNTGTGGIHVRAAEGASVTIDGQYVGRAPITQSNLGAWIHRVHVELDGGGSADHLVTVEPGRVAEIDVPLPALRLAADHRRGVHFALGAGPLGGFGPKRSHFGLAIHTGINVALSAGLDLRVVGQTALGSIGSDSLWYDFAASGALRFNFTSVYSIETGASVGVLSDQYSQAAFAVGIELSALSFRFGEDRNYELTLWHSFHVGLSETRDPDDSFDTPESPMALSTGLLFTRVF